MNKLNIKKSKNLQLEKQLMLKIEQLEQWKDEVISIIKEDKDFASQAEEQDEGIIKQKEMWNDISSMISSIDNSERDYIKKGFKLVKKVGDETTVSCPLWCGGTQINAAGTGGHWRRHTTQLEKLSFTIGKDKINVTCQRCEKKMKIYDALEHVKAQHYQDIKKDKSLNKK